MSSKLKTKVDYYGLGSTGWEVQSTSENRNTPSITAQGNDGFIIATCNLDSTLQPQCEYVATGSATASIKLGKLTEVESHKFALGSVTINTSAGAAPTMTASGSEVPAGATENCTCTLADIAISHLFHAQNFGLFTVSGGDLTQSTFTATGDIATVDVDGELKSYDLVGGSVTITGTIVGVDPATGNISRPTVAIGTLGGKNGSFTQEVSETNPNSAYPTYSFGIIFPLSADKKA